MSFGADWTCACGWANLDVRKRCRNCNKEPAPPSSTENIRQNASEERQETAGLLVRLRNVDIDSASDCYRNAPLFGEGAAQIEADTALITRLEERCEAYKGQVKAGEDEIARLQRQYTRLERMWQAQRETICSLSIDLQDIRTKQVVAALSGKEG